MDKVVTDQNTTTVLHCILKEEKKEIFYLAI